MISRYFFYTILIQATIILVAAGTYNVAKAEECQLNAGAYIAHSRAAIEKLWSNVYKGNWGYAKTMAKQGKLRKIGSSWRIQALEVDDTYVKFSVNNAPGKEIWTLKMFTAQCN
jgi:hypothetical protein